MNSVDGQTSGVLKDYAATLPVLLLLPVEHAGLIRTLVSPTVTPSMVIVAQQVSR
jgi:hypothetical protein